MIDSDFVLGGTRGLGRALTAQSRLQGHEVIAAGRSSGPEKDLRMDLQMDLSDLPAEPDGVHPSLRKLESQFADEALASGSLLLLTGAV